MTFIADAVLRGPDVHLRISEHLAGEVDIRSALSAVATEISEIIPYTHADICLHDSPGWVVSYEVGIRTRWSRKRTRVQYSPVRDLLTGRTDLMLTGNAMRDPRYIYPGAACEPIINHQMRSRVNVPMKVMGRVIGTLNFSHSIESLYDHGTAAEAQHLANVLAPYFHALHASEKAQQATKVRAMAQAREEGLRQGALELTQALEAERQRVGMDLHDQTLADLTRLLREVSGDGPVPGRAALARKIDDCIVDLRRIIDTAVPTLLDLFGFAHAVRVHLERAVGVSNVAIDVDDDTDGAPDALDRTTRTALFRIAQEAINNAARHSGATRIGVGIGRDVGQRLCITINDNGCGLGDGTTRRSGLMHMRTRADLIGAELDIVDDGGTCVAVTLAEART
ncbi:GAF domain-containing sensor histidine kinase [Salipiger sp.]|uniref:GAF domain-containing sensor histidine kinase n=1 Tax=Salipiger sp. TaxID=2078585 RepID=UPI003A97A038